MVDVRAAGGASPSSNRPTRFFVMFYVGSRQVDRSHPMFSVDCPLDGGGREVHWFTNVPAGRQRRLPEDLRAPPAPGSPIARWRRSRCTTANRRSTALIALARDDASSKVRGSALFWLAQRAGEKAVGAIGAAVDNDPDTEVKKKAVFALSQLPRDEGVPLLIQQAQTNRNAAVRKQAMFWLGQSSDPRALTFFEELLR